MVKAAEMMRVLSMSPMMMRVVWARRRGMLRRPTRNMTRFRSAVTPTVARLIPRRISRATMMEFIGMPKRLCMAAGGYLSQRAGARSIIFSSTMRPSTM